jgi:hypothetical protein
MEIRELSDLELNGVNGGHDCKEGNTTTINLGPFGTFSFSTFTCDGGRIKGETTMWTAPK